MTVRLKNISVRSGDLLESMSGCCAALLGLAELLPQGSPPSSGADSVGTEAPHSDQKSSAREPHRTQGRIQEFKKVVSDAADARVSDVVSRVAQVRGKFLVVL